MKQFYKNFILSFSKCYHEWTVRLCFKVGNNTLTNTKFNLKKIPNIRFPIETKLSNENVKFRIKSKCTDCLLNPLCWPWTDCRRITKEFLRKFILNKIDVSSLWKLEFVFLFFWSTAAATDFSTKSSHFFLGTIIEKCH